MLVVDASVLAVALLDDGPDGDHLRTRLRGEDLAAPSLIDLEVVSVWRGLYDASYVALAEALKATLLTGDRRIARVPGPTCPNEIMKPPSRHY